MAKVRLAMMGCGGNSGGHAQRLREHPDVKIVACCDVKDELVKGYIERHLKGKKPLWQQRARR